MKVLKKSSLFAALTIVLIGFGSCHKDNEPEGVPLVSGITLSKTEINLYESQQAQITATLSITDVANSPKNVWTSSNSAVATVNSAGMVTALQAGTAIVTVTAGEQRANCQINVFAVPTSVPNNADGVVINGIRWASCNLDAEGAFAATPESTGKFFQWNRKKAWAIEGEVIDMWGDLLIFIADWDATSAEGDYWYSENNPSPAGWRVPDVEEFQSLLSVANAWVTINGVGGRIFGSGENVLFFPAVSGITNEGIYRSSNLNKYGYYFSRTPYYDKINIKDAYFLGFNEERGAYVDFTKRNVGFTIRCVAR